MFVVQSKLPTAEEMCELVPASKQIAGRKFAYDAELRRLQLGRKKLIVVCGPCAADNPEAVAEYVRELKKLSAKTPDLYVVARIYTAKPHSDGTGYPGVMFGDDGVDMSHGIAVARKMMIDCLSVGLPVADEILYPELYPYFSDLISYAFVGARSSYDALHRAYASGLTVCCGVKNGLDGNVSAAVDSLNAVAMPSVLPIGGEVFATNGNEFAHIVLRGGMSEKGFVPNLGRENIAEAKRLLHAKALNDFVMVDLSHANSGKRAEVQLANARLVAANTNVNGVMAESYLHGGKGNEYGVSRTDECLSLEQTAELLQILQEGFVTRIDK